MRLKSVRLDKFGPFEFQEIELAPLTILFGPNGAGKSTVLDAIEDALTLSGGRQQFAMSEPTDSRSSVVYATLDDRLIPESSDQRIMRHVLWKNLKGIDDSQLTSGDPFKDCPQLEDLLGLKATEMIESGTQGTPEARRLIAAHLLRHSVLAFGGLQGETDGNWGLVCFASLDELTQYTDTFDTSTIESDDSDNSDEAIDAMDDTLLMAVSNLGHGEDATVTMEWGEPEWELSQGRKSSRAVAQTLFSKIRPLPMRLDFDPETLELELEIAVSRIAGQLRYPNQNYEISKVSWLASNDLSRVIMPASAFEYLQSDIQVDRDLRPPNSVQEEDEIYVLSPLVRRAVMSIAEHANEIAPKFITEDSKIEIDIVRPSEWQTASPRLRVSISQGRAKFPLAHVGSGIARWASYSIRLACQQLFHSQIVVRGNDGSQLPDDEIPYQVINDSSTSLESILKLQIIPQKMDVVLLMDEPEAHLHPRAVASIGEWLLDFSPRVASVVVATHHPSLFNLQGPNVQKHVLLKNKGTSVSKPWDPASEELVAQLAREIGLTPGDLFMMSRYALFVEGPHDLVILEEFFGELLRGTSIRVLPLHGAHNISLLATSEIVWQMGIPIGVLTDDTNIERVMRGERSGHMEKLVDRLLRECKTENRKVDPFGLSLEDVLFYLDNEVTATFASEEFPGWSMSRTIWNQIVQPVSDTTNGAKFKKWIEKSYGLPLDRDSVRNIAKRCKEMGIIPEELSKVVANVISKTM